MHNSLYRSFASELPVNLSSAKLATRLRPEFPHVDGADYVVSLEAVYLARLSILQSQSLLRG